MKKVSFDNMEEYIGDSLPDDEEISHLINSPALNSIMKKNLSDKQILYVTLYYRKNMTLEEIAEMCKVTPSTVSRTIERARRRIFGGMEQDCFRRLLGGSTNEHSHN